MKIIVSRNELLAALIFSSDDETRFVLNGVCVEVSPRSLKPTLITTDGRRLAVIESQAEQSEVFAEFCQVLFLRAGDAVSTGGESFTITPENAKKIIASCDTILKGGEESGSDEDEDLIQQCIEVIRGEQKASVSFLQRRLRLGYTRAARIMDELENRAIVGPTNGAEPRDILIDLPTTVS